MTFDDYQKEALKTDDSVGHDLVSAEFMAIALGLMSEAGEFGEKLKKIYWHKKGVWTEEDKTELAKELGDVLWYTSSLAGHVGLSLEEIAKQNLEKIKSRVDRGVHQGFGDNR
jgi:NTP pyrophosphatase (non-canonical NTP hydrolase)